MGNVVSLQTPNPQPLDHHSQGQIEPTTGVGAKAEKEKERLGYSKENAREEGKEISPNLVAGSNQETDESLGNSKFKGEEEKASLPTPSVGSREEEVERLPNPGSGALEERSESLGDGEDKNREEEEETECGFCLFMKGGGCKDIFTAWEKCVEAVEDKEDIVDKCFEVTELLKKCMDAHADYYEPILRAEKAMEEEVARELNLKATPEATAAAAASAKEEK